MQTSNSGQLRSLFRDVKTPNIRKGSFRVILQEGREVSGMVIRQGWVRKKQTITPGIKGRMALGVKIKGGGVVGLGKVWSMEGRCIGERQ